MYSVDSLLTMNMGELQTAIMKVVDDTDYTNLVASYINRAQNELALLSKKRYRATVAVISGVLSMPPNCLVPTRVVYNNVPLDRWPSDILPEAATGTPVYWYTEDNGSVTIYPAPVGDVSAQLIYIKLPYQVSDTEDYPGIARANEYIIAWSIGHMMMDRNDSQNQYEPWLGLAEAKKMLWLANNDTENRRPHNVRPRPYC